MHAPNANITLMANSEGVGCNYDFKVLARGENLHISGDCLYRTAVEKFDLVVNLDEVRPALLTEILPQFTYLTPLEMRLSGKVLLELDNLLKVNKAEFDLTSDKGTLEVIDYIGKNLKVNALHIVGKALNNYSHVELDNLIVDLEDNKVEGNALFLKGDNSIDIKFNVFFAGTSISSLLPRWFSYLENENLKCIQSFSKVYSQASLTVDGSYDLKQHTINALGHITCLDVKLANNNGAPSSSTNLGTDPNSIQSFRMDGTFESPNLTIIQ